MSIRPVDMQITFNKGSESTKMNDNQDSSRLELQNHRLASEMQKQSEANTSTVIQTSKSEQGAIHKDGKGQGERKKENRKTREKAKEASNEKAKNLGLFDVSI